MTPTTPFVTPFASLDAAGLNLQALFDLDQLPTRVWDSFGLDEAEVGRWSQLLLLGHGGRQLWQRIAAAGMSEPDPIDRYSVAQVDALFARELAGQHYRLLYPAQHPLALQALGELAGWHYPSPFRVGVNQRWGSWFAYRAVVLTDTQLPPFTSDGGGGACAHCLDKPCVSACAGQVLGEGSCLDGCIAFRLQQESPCAEACPARRACPVAQGDAYGDDQLRYHYRQSLHNLRRWARSRSD